MDDKISVIVKNVKDLDNALSSNSKDELLIRRLTKVIKEDLETITAVIDFEEASDNYEAANILRPIKEKMLSLLEVA